MIAKHGTASWPAALLLMFMSDDARFALGRAPLLLGRRVVFVRGSSCAYSCLSKFAFYTWTPYSVWAVKGPYPGFSRVHCLDCRAVPS